MVFLIPLSAHHLNVALQRARVQINALLPCVHIAAAALGGARVARGVAARVLALYRLLPLRRLAR